jgi:hypothetical protein
MSKFFLSVVCFLSIVNGSAEAQIQSDTIKILKEIDQICSIVKDNIERKEFLLNEFKVNSNYLNRHLPDVFQYIEKYYFTFTTQNQSDASGLLRSVILTKEKEGLVMYREFIFNINSELVFYSEKARRDGSIPRTLRKIYFQDEVLIHNINDASVIAQLQIDLSNHLPSAIPHEAQKIQKRFQAQFSGKREY